MGKQDLQESRHAFVLTASLMLLLALVLYASERAGGIQAPAVGGQMQSVLVIDAGHGGIDSGAIGVDGSRECDINLSIALRVQALCDFYGIPYRMTRLDDSRATDANTYSEHQELVYRTELANSTPQAVFLSIHQNYFPTAQPGGSQLIYSPNRQSQLFAETIFANILATLEPESRRIPIPDQGKLYVLTHTKCPAVLVECGFLSNHTDITKLNDPIYQTELAGVLTASYVQYQKNVKNI